MFYLVSLAKRAQAFFLSKKKTLSRDGRLLCDRTDSVYLESNAWVENGCKRVETLIGQAHGINSVLILNTRGWLAPFYAFTYFCSFPRSLFIFLSLLFYLLILFQGIVPASIYSTKRFDFLNVVNLNS